MRILGLDISSASTGWAVLDDGVLLSRDNVGLIKFKAKQPHGERLVGFEARLREIITQFKPDLIAIEDLYLSFTNPRVSVVLAYYHGAAKKVVWDLMGVEPIVETATNFRKVLGAKYGVNLLPGKKEKLATGKDSKHLTFELIQKIFGLDDWTFSAYNDKADALCVGLAATLAKQRVQVEAVQRTKKARAKGKGSSGSQNSGKEGLGKGRKRKKA